MTLREIKPYLSTYNHISLRLRNEFNCMFAKEIFYNLLKDMDDTYLDYEIFKIETNKTHTLVITLYDRTWKNAL